MAPKPCQRLDFARVLAMLLEFVRVLGHSSLFDMTNSISSGCRARPERKQELSARNPLLRVLETVSRPASDGFATTLKVEVIDNSSWSYPSLPPPVSVRGTRFRALARA